MIAIIEDGMGKKEELEHVLQHIGYATCITAEGDQLSCADGLVLTGEGHFLDGMCALKKRGLTEKIRHLVLMEQKPILGIGLGMHLLFSNSEEEGFYQGLHLLPGRVVGFSEGMQSHVGWSSLQFTKPDPLFKEVQEGVVYFNHTAYALPDNQEDCLAVTYYQQEIPAIVGRNQIMGMQFHPEASGVIGKHLLKRFVELVFTTNKRRHAWKKVNHLCVEENQWG